MTMQPQYAVAYESTPLTEIAQLEHAPSAITNPTNWILSKLDIDLITMLSSDLKYSRFIKRWFRKKYYSGFPGIFGIL